MKIDRLDIIKVQIVLKKLGLYRLDIDGIYGKGTIGALNKYHPTVSNAETWRKIPYFIQLFYTEMMDENIEIDGFFGPQTDYALDMIEMDVFGLKADFKRTDEGFLTSSHIWPDYGSAKFLEIFGEPGENIIEIDVQYPMVYAFDNSIQIKKIKCNKEIAYPLSEVLCDIYTNCGEECIKELGLDQYGGCYVFRNMTGSRKLSTHAWGIAIDLHPEMNRYNWGEDKAVFARDEYKFLHSAFEKRGFLNLGKTYGFDYMHFQACGQ